MKNYKYLFGPVPSRRFGRSLGVDLTTGKTCTMDCPFCQLGRTTLKTTGRREYVPAKDVTREIKEWLDSGGTADYITLSGSGEPTLHSRFGDIIDFIHGHTRIPVLLLTNSSLLHLPEVRAAAAKADVVKVSLSAWDQASFEQINKPAAGLTFDACLAGLKAFRAGFKGQLWMEVFLLDGVNSSNEAVKKIAGLAASIEPDRIQLNTVVRPPADECALAVTNGRMKDLADLFTPKAETLEPTGNGPGAKTGITDEAILPLLRRHPCTVAQLALMFDAGEDEIRQHIDRLAREGKVRVKDSGGVAHYTA